MKNTEKKHRRVPIPVVILVWIVAIAAVTATVAYSFVSYQLKPMTTAEEEYTVDYKLPAGKSVMEVAKDLEDSKLVRKWQDFYYAIRFGKYLGIESTGVKTGTYSLKSSMSVKELASLLSTGTAEYVTITIPEGLTIRKTAPIFEEAGLCKAEDFIALCHDKDFIAHYEIPSDSLEGFLYPDTYDFDINSSAPDIVNRLVSTFFNKTELIPSLKGKTPEEMFKTVVLASIVEREYKSPSEAALIAGVFTNRLKSIIKLESCATVEYVITEVLGKPHPERIYYADLRIDNPYNTYKHYGLPPAPIANPGFTALKAAADPAETDYYYFVLSDENAGTHTFTKTLSQHNAAKSLYIKD